MRGLVGATLQSEMKLRLSHNLDENLITMIKQAVQLHERRGNVKHLMLVQSPWLIRRGGLVRPAGAAYQDWSAGEKMHVEL